MTLDGNAVRSVDRAASLLLALGDCHGDAGVTELARRLGLHKSTASRLLATLEKRGLVEQDEESGKYRLGLIVIRLAERAERTLDLRSIAMPELDRYALVTLSDLVRDVTVAYDEWRFHAVYRLLYEYCGADLSSFYLDVLKDRLYADAPDSLGRRSAQTVLATMLGAMVRMVAPILTFTSEEIWQVMPEALRGDIVSVQLAGWPEVTIDEAVAAPLRDAYAVVRAVREDVTKALEDARTAGLVGKSQEAAVAIGASDEAVAVLAARPALADLFIVAQVSLRGGAEAVAVEIARAEGGKCPRCWNIRTDIGSVPAHPDVCGRCAAVLGR